MVSLERISEILGHEKNTKGRHCSYCGAVLEGKTWPKRCIDCDNITYVNPLPIAALLVPVETDSIYDFSTHGGLLVVRRGEDPHKGELALAGGYLELGETWQEGAARELKEETGVVIDSKDISLKTIITSPTNGNLILFCKTPSISLKEIENFKSNSEVAELVVLNKPQELAFSTHTEVFNNYLLKLERYLIFLETGSA